MKKQQLFNRLGPEVVERVIRRFNDADMTLREAMDAIGVCKAQLYNLRTQWLAAGKSVSFLRYGLPEALYTDAFTMFGKEGVDLCSQFGRMCRALGINHMVAPSPEAKGKIERAMRTFQHRLVVVLTAEGVDCEAKANALVGEHVDFWNASHLNEETGEIPDERAGRLVACGRSRMRPVTDEKLLRLFLSRHVPRRVELGYRIEFLGRTWKIARTLKKTAWLAVRPGNRGFYVLEERPDPTRPVIPRVLLAHRF